MREEEDDYKNEGFADVFGEVKPDRVLQTSRSTMNKEQDLVAFKKV